MRLLYAQVSSYCGEGISRSRSLTEDGQNLTFRECLRADTYRYAIVSHRWTAEEVSGPNTFCFLEPCRMGRIGKKVLPEDHVKLLYHHRSSSPEHLPYL